MGPEKNMDLKPSASAQFDWPLLKLCKSQGGQYVATASGLVDKGNHVTVLDAETCQVTSQVPSLFPPSSIAFGKGDVLAVAGEAIALWDNDSRLLAYCVPELFVPSHGEASANPVWSITHLEWSVSDTLLACHRSGPIGLYPVARLPSGRREALGQTHKGGQGLLARVAKSLFGSNSKEDATLRIVASHQGPVCEVVAKGDGGMFYTCAKYLGSSSQVAAARHGSASLQLVDLNGKTDVPKWDVALTGVSQLCVQPGPSPDYLIGLDKQCGMLYVYDKRKASGNILEPVAKSSASDLFGDMTLINDVSWTENNTLLFSLQSRPTGSHTAAAAFQPIAEMSASNLLGSGGGAPIPINRAQIDWDSAYSRRVSNQLATSMLNLGANRLAVAWSSIYSQPESLDMRDEEPSSVLLPSPPDGGASFRSTRFMSTRPWQLTVGRLVAP
eukprot:Blabericola_migrator_1__1443@NODE_137_length_13158_cov_138_292491_g119_i0_p3_GENE_NODE_137_length_13158_cov_138_292491_g119_i0NODE_137_length_13158_cov_138_292491_g119_i0_p3_ORF_typecomplete_len443_score82_97_NODE_137_length_13158_cov_138_292491_g119_i048566184